MNESSPPADAHRKALIEYSLVERLNESRTGVIYKAVHRTLGRTVAIKVLSPETIASAQMKERFERKTKILARLSHANLIAAHDAGQREGVYYLVMEYVDGQDLASLTKRDGPLPVETAVNYIWQAALGLQYAHQQGVFHRNLKPANLMVDRQGTIKIVGFGLAHVAAGEALADEGMGELTLDGQVLGTCEYMAPEQAVQSKSVDARADIYSLGCTLYALVTGKKPYAGKGLMQQIAAHRDQPIPSLRAERPEAPESVDRVYQKMLAKRPDDRQPSMAALIDELNAVWQQAFSPASAETPPEGVLADLPSEAVDAEAAPPAAEHHATPPALPTYGGEPPPLPQSAPSQPEPIASLVASAQRRPLVPIVGVCLVSTMLLIVAMWVWYFNVHDRRSHSAKGKARSDVITLKLGQQIAEAPADASSSRLADMPAEPATKVPSEVARPEAPPAAPAAKKASQPAAKEKPVEAATPGTRATEAEPKAVKPPSSVEPAPQPSDMESANSSQSAGRLEATKITVDRAKLAEAAKLAREVFKEALAEADSSPAQRALAEKISTAAGESGSDSASRFALLRLACDLAVQGGDLIMLFQFLDTLDRDFVIDASAIRTELILSMAKASRGADDRRALIDQALRLMTDAVDKEKFALMEELGRLAASEAAKLLDKDVIKQVQTHTKEMQAVKQSYANAESARAKLAQSPDNAEAHLMLGRYLWVSRRDWSAAMPHLAQGSNALIAALAARDRDNPDDPAEQAKLADAWWDAGQASLGWMKAPMLQRARHWYEQCLASMESGLLKTKIEKRLKEIGELGQSGPVAGRDFQARSRMAAIKPWDAKKVGLLATISGQTSPIRAVAFAPSGAILYAGSSDRRMCAWEWSTARLLWQHKGLTGNLQSLAVSPDGAIVALGCGDALRLVDVFSGRVRANLPVAGSHIGIAAVAFSPNGSWLITAGDPQQVRVYSAGGELARSISCEASAVACDPDSSNIASNYANNTVRIWRLRSGEVKQTLSGHAGQVLAVAFSPDGSLLATASTDKSVRLWRTATGRCERILDGHTDIVRTLAFHPSGQQLASAGNDAKVRLWDVETGHSLVALADHVKPVWSLAFHPGGTVLASGSEDATIKLWGLLPAKSRPRK